MSLDQSQQLAVDGISTLSARLYLLTGAGGSGKTFTLQHLLKKLWAIPGSGIRNDTTFLAAATGKAAKVIADSLPEDFLHNAPSTIHRMLEYAPHTGWGYNADNKLPAALIILDESSMIDSELMARVIDAAPGHCRIILVGDVNQLPPVAPGQPFADLIALGDSSTVFRLTTNHRQTQGSLIADGCLRVLAGEKLLFGQPGGRTMGGILQDDMFFHEIEEKEEIPQRVVDLCRDWHRNCLDYAVLAPQRTGVCGVEALNKFLQESLNPARDGKQELSFGFMVLREGDRVLQTKNNYVLGVFNGFMGIITNIDRIRKAITVQFDDEEITYEEPDHVKQLALGYCLTVHKSQGSQFQYGVLVCHSSHYYMWSRSLLYTGVSRFRKELHVVGNKKALDRGRTNVQSTERNTFIKLSMAGK